MRHEIYSQELPGYMAALTALMEYSESQPVLPYNSQVLQAQLYADQAFSYYTEALLHSERGLEYLQQRRGLIDPEAILALGIGFADRTLGKTQIPDGETREGGAIRGALQRLGLLKPSGHELFRGCLTFPLVDASDHVVGAYGRLISEKAHSGPHCHLWWGSGDAGVFNRQALRDHSELILCKSPLEATTLWCAGYRNAISVVGMRGLSEIHLDEFESHGIKRVDIAFDLSPVGHDSACLIAQVLNAQGIECRQLEIPAGEDLNQLLFSMRDSFTDFSCLVNTARPCSQSYEQLQWEVVHACSSTIDRV